MKISPKLELGGERDMSISGLKLLLTVAVCASAVAFGATSPAVAHHSESQCEFDSPDPLDPLKCGEIGKLIPVPIDAIHAGLSWTPGSSPKVCMGMRPSEYAGHHLVDDDHVLREPFRELVYGGGNFSTGAHGLDEANEKGDITRDNFVCWDLTHPDAFKDGGVFDLLDGNEPPNATLTDSDLALTHDAFIDVGDQAGLEGNIFCAGNVALADGRWMFIGGHDKGGNNGIRKLHILDPVKELWADRGPVPVKEAYLAGFPFSEPLPVVPDDFPDANDEDNTDPPHPSDMKYQRWYPSGTVMPDKSVLIVAGTDRDTSLGTGRNCASDADRAQETRCSLRTQVVPEIYFPSKDETVALENARKHHNTFPRVYPVQTGKGKKDWKVAIIGEAHPDALAKDDGGSPILGLAPLSVVTQYDPYTYTGATYLLDVQAALKDPARGTPGENHYQFVDAAKNAHNFGAGAQLWKTDKHGRAIQQKVALFGGNCGGTRNAPNLPQPDPEVCTGDLIEVIDFEDADPGWQQLDAKLYLPISQNNASVLPDGKVLISGGATGRGPWTNSFHLQLFDPQTETMEVLVDSKIARHDHSTMALLPDGSVAILGGNATDLHGDTDHLDLGVPVAQIFKPPYFFKGPKPHIKKAPDKITYRQRFNLRIGGKNNDDNLIRSVALIRFGPITHNWDWGKRYVELWFKQKGNKLLVQAPAAPGLAVPGYYMLFVVNKNGVPGVATVVHLDQKGRRSKKDDDDHDDDGFDRDNDDDDND